jgi:hypothetical protein
MLPLAVVVAVGAAVAVGVGTEASNRRVETPDKAATTVVTHSSAIDQAIKAGGSFFTPAEQAVISKKCGYAPGEWDGMDMHISKGVFNCRNGKRVDDPEMRSLLQGAQPRIERRLALATGRPEGPQARQ